MQEQSFSNAAESTAFRVLLTLGLSHLLNDTLQSVITAVYPLLKESMALSFVQIGFITLVYQISASVFQPLVGFYLDKRPNPWFLPVGMSFTLVGLVVLAFSVTLHQVLCSVFLIGIGSSILHPEASRLTSLASGGKRGLAQSVFQVGGNMGSSLGPLLAALCIEPYGQRNIVFFALLALCAILVMMPICRWYKRKLKALRLDKGKSAVIIPPPLSRRKTIFSLLYIFSDREIRCYRPGVAIFPVCILVCFRFGYLVGRAYRRQSRSQVCHLGLYSGSGAF